MRGISAASVGISALVSGVRWAREGSRGMPKLAHVMLRAAVTSFALHPSSINALLVTDGPYIICYRGKVGLGELAATHGRHHTGVLLGLRYAVSNRPGARLDAAVAP